MFVFIFQRPPHLINRAYCSGSVHMCTLLPYVAAGGGMEHSIACAGGKGTGRCMQLPLHLSRLISGHDAQETDSTLKAH